MKAVKQNKEYSIDESQKKNYQDKGFDIKEDSGKVIAYGRGKTVPYEDYEKLHQQNSALKEQIEKISAENENLKADRDAKATISKTKEPKKNKSTIIKDSSDDAKAGE